MNFTKHLGQYAIAQLAICLFINSVSSSYGDTVSISPTKDNTIYNSATGALSNGAGDRIFAGRTGGGGPGIVRGLLNFDIAAAIPSGATVNSVDLMLVIEMAAGNSNGTDVSLHAVAQDWGEGTSNAETMPSAGIGGQGGGANATTGDATWLHTFFSTSTWTNPGGDFNLTASATKDITTGPGQVTWSSTSTLVSDVQGWLDNPASNYGWILIGEESSNGTAFAFSSREASSGAPVLTIDYTNVPEPGTSTLVLLAILSFPLRKRNRKTITV